MPLAMSRSIVRICRGGGTGVKTSCAAQVCSCKTTRSVEAETISLNIGRNEHSAEGTRGPVLARKRIMAEGGSSCNGEADEETETGRAAQFPK